MLWYISLSSTSAISALEVNFVGIFHLPVSGSSEDGVWCLVFGNVWEVQGIKTLTGPLLQAIQV